MIEKKSIIFHFIAYSFLFLLLLSYADTGVVGDDILNSLICGDAINKGTTFGQDVLFYLKELLKQGRTNVVSSTITYLTFYVFKNRVVYKIWIAFLTLVTLFCGEKFFEYHFQNKKAGVMFCCISISIIPLYYSGSNSYVMYNGFMQYQVIMLFMIMYFFEKYVRESQKKYLVISCVLYLVSFFVYEISILYFIPSVGISIALRGREIKKLIQPYFFILLGSGFFILIVRIASKLFSAEQVNYDGVSFGFDIIALIKTFLIQFSGGIPLNGIISENIVASEIARINKPFEFIVIAIASWAVLLILFLLANTQYNDEQAIRNKARILSIVVPASLIWVGISGMISLSQKYQKELPITHFPHIPAFVESYCCAAIITSLYFLLNNKRIRFFLMILFCLIGCINASASVLYAKQYEEQTGIYKEIPEAYQEAIDAGLLEMIDDEDLVLIDVNYSPTLYPNHLALYANKRVIAKRLDVYLQELSDLFNSSQFDYYPEKDIYITKCFLSDDQRVVYLDKISKIIINNEGQYIEVSNINSWCDTKQKNDYLYVKANNQDFYVQTKDCKVRCKKNGEIIELPSGNYNYHSYTFWGEIQ